MHELFISEKNLAHADDKERGLGRVKARHIVLEPPLFPDCPFRDRESVTRVPVPVILFHARLSDTRAHAVVHVQAKLCNVTR